MKKLVKKTLDELAKDMPVLSEKNQHECVGGFVFVSATGNYMAANTMTSGGGNPLDEIRVISGSDFSGYETAVSRGTLSTYIGGKSLLNLSSNEAGLVVLGIGSELVGSGFSYWSYDYEYLNSTNYSNSISIDGPNSLSMEISTISTASGIKSAWQDLVYSGMI